MARWRAWMCVRALGTASGMSGAGAKDVRSVSGRSDHPAAGQPGAAADSRAGEACPRIAVGEALRNHWFEIWYQPKIDLKRKCLAGAEALARIRHPQHGLVPPGASLTDVDENSVAELTQYALAMALRDWSLFEDAGFNLQLSLNVPAGVLRKLPVAKLVAEFRPKSQRWPGLIVELAEDQIVRDPELAAAIARQLQVSGIKIAIDNFGAGHSSFSSLRQLPFVEMKLDCSLVAGCSADPITAAICQTVIDLAHRFGAAAVADGVDSQADLQALIGMGCDFGQGGLIAPAMPKERFLELLHQRTSKPHGASPREVMKSGAKPVGRVA